jgi:hypothetical protein
MVALNIMSPTPMSPTPMHPYSSRAFQWYQEHGGYHDSGDFNMTNK